LVVAAQERAPRHLDRHLPADLTPHDLVPGRAGVRPAVRRGSGEATSTVPRLFVVGGSPALTLLAAAAVVAWGRREPIAAMRRDRPIGA
jgi:hypothetical protein